MTYNQSIAPLRPVTADTTELHKRPHYDGCPNCLVRGNTPVHTQDDDGEGCICIYLCRKCGHRWWTSWFCEEKAE